MSARRRRIVIGGMNHESNTLNPIITGREDFVIFHGEEMCSRGMLPAYAATGIVKALSLADCELVPTLLARAVPNGPVSGELYSELKAEMLSRIIRALAEGPLDGVCLTLHGSMKVEGIGCAEGDLLIAIRRLLPAVPITVALDMHATITDEMLAAADGFVGYKTAPHIDCAETGEAAARMLLASLASGLRLMTEACRIPFLIAGEKSETSAEPMVSLIALLREEERKPGVLAASYLLGFPWADDEHAGACALVTTLGDDVMAGNLADKLARQLWVRRDEFTFRVEHYSSDMAVKTALNAAADSKGTVVLSDSGDNPTAGSTGDATELLEALLDRLGGMDAPLVSVLYSGFFEEESTRRCVQAGPGSRLRVEVGGVWDRRDGRRIPLDVEVLRFVRHYGPYGADLVLLRHYLFDLVLTSKHIGFGDEGLLPALGIDPRSYGLVVVKLGYLEECFRSIASRAILATSRGCSNEVLESIPYARLPRPIYPLDPNAALECRS